MTFKIRFLREVSLVIVCVLGAAIGPVILINAKFSIHFLIGGLLFTILCMGLLQIIELLNSMLKKTIGEVGKYIIGIIIGYIPFWGIVIYLFKFDLFSLFKFYKGEALFNFPIIIGAFPLLMLYLILVNLKIKEIFLQTGLYYLFPIFLVILIIPAIPNSEGKVLFGNIAVLYSFLRLILINSPLKKTNPI
ncbi:MAG: hypothetical protein M0Z31_05710 [Clostridia bacterium]|nr:hypothetical protein [Clostridia bacterium]